MTPRVIRICFVCMGNICRSPMAECVFRNKIAQRNVAHLFQVDSAGTGGWHAGQEPDERAQSCLRRNHVAVMGCARQVRRDDFQQFDLLICMDHENHEHLRSMGAPGDKLRLLLEYDPSLPRREVPDPYHGGDDGFDEAYHLINRACESLLDQLLADTR